MEYFDIFKDPEPLTNVQLTQHVRMLQRVVLQLAEERDRRGNYASPVRGLICVNTSLHGYQAFDEWQEREHPADLTVPHWTFQPMWNWGDDMIALHPGNRPRA